MPQGDRTGPEGKGPLTGRGQGFCMDFEIPEIEFSEFDREFGRRFRGFGRGYGRGFRFRVQPREFTKEEQIELLKKQKEDFEDQGRAFEGRALAIGNQLKEFEKPLKEIGKPLVKRLTKKKVGGNK